MDRAPSETVCVFTPSPLFTVTVELSAQQEPEVHFHGGGQGVWVARMAKELGVAVRLCGPFGGESGRILALLIESEGIEVRQVECQAANGGYIHDRRGGEREEVVDTRSPTLTRHETDDLYNIAIVEGLEAGVVVLTGAKEEDVIAADVFGRLAKDYANNGVRVIADISGDPLRSLEGGVHVLKVSHSDLMRDRFVTSDHATALIEAMRKLQEATADNVIVTRAEEPSLALFEDGRVVEVISPRFDALDHRGAGDSLTAAVAAGLAGGRSFEDCLRLGAAAGALNVTRHGLGSGRSENIEALASQVEVRAVAS